MAGLLVQAANACQVCIPMPVKTLADRLLEADALVERSVEPGLRNWDFTEIRGGLEGGELLVISLDRPEIQPGARAVAAEGPAGQSAG